MADATIVPLAINTIRTLAMDAVQQDNSGHPGTPMALAPVAYCLWQHFLRFDPDHPIWPNRDRFVLSVGHASMLLYALLHLTGVKAVNPKYEVLGTLAVALDDIKRFRQLDSKCPGHPEYRWASGIETTTGPLGQGVATSVGMAIAARWLASYLHRPGFALFDYDVYALAGDGCLMEGISGEAASLAGHFKLANLCWIYANNRITIEGHTALANSDDVATRFIGYGWHVTDSKIIKLFVDDEPFWLPTAPDEYNTVVNNNASTNLMARANLRYAAETVAALRATHPEVSAALVHTTALAPAEVEAWQHAAERMYVPYDAQTGLTLQYDGFLDDEPWDFHNTPPDRYPLLLFYHPLNIYRKQVIKQADVVLAMFLLGKAFSLEAKQRNFAFYDPLTTGDSSLSSCIEAIIAAEVGAMDKAVRYGMAALLMDLADVGGNVKDGCHIASMGGTWMMLVYGFGGLQDADGTLAFWPRRAPEDNAILRFSLTYRGQRLEVEIGRETATYALREGAGLVLRHETEEIQLTPEQPRAVRPVSRQ